MQCPALPAVRPVTPLPGGSLRKRECQGVLRTDQQVPMVTEQALNANGQLTLGECQMSSKTVVTTYPALPTSQ